MRQLPGFGLVLPALSLVATTTSARGIRELTRKWLPVDMYIGGAEHSVLHLMYARFITMALHDLGHLDFEEPFTRFRANGIITKDGAKMSKSRGNVINPDEYHGCATAQISSASICSSWGRTRRAATSAIAGSAASCASWIVSGG